MINAWWLGLAFLIGALFGFFFFAIISVGN